MAQQWQIRRGTNSENNDFTGAAGEVTMDTDRKELRLHDGSTQGGTIIGRNYKSNCITEIPQDIKLELNNGTLTLKAGSKVYVPNGVGVFDEVVIASDLIIPGWNNVAQGMLSIKPSTSGIWVSLMNQQYSGSTMPTGSQYELWYDTNSNKVKTTSNTGSTWTDGYSLPIALITSNGSSWTSIDQVFNGFGYIGSTVFALPGVEGLGPNGFNEDGSLKTIKYTISNVLIFNEFNNNQSDFVMITSTDLSRSQAKATRYDEKTNTIKRTTDDLFPNHIMAAKVSCNSTGITSFSINMPFHPINYSEADFVVSYQRPTSANDYTWYRLYKSGWVEQGGIKSNASGSRTVGVTFPVTMLDTNYTASTTLNYGSTDWSATVNCLVLTKTTTGLTLMNYYNSSSNNGPMTWLIQGFSNINV